ncbi:hypothetical protein SRHO_G00333910 [Serrasalmus rhombeus]
MPLLVALVSLAYLSLLQRNEIILPQAVCGLEKLLVTTEAMVARPKPGGRLSEFLADMRLQRRQQQEEGEMAIYKSQGRVLLSLTQPRLSNASTFSIMIAGQRTKRT